MVSDGMPSEQNWGMGLGEGMVRAGMPRRDVTIGPHHEEFESTGHILRHRSSSQFTVSATSQPHPFSATEE